MWRNFIFATMLCHAHVRLAGATAEGASPIEPTIGEDVHALLQTRAQPQSHLAATKAQNTNTAPSLLLETVRSLAMNFQSQPSQTVIDLIGQIQTAIDTEMKPSLMNEHGADQEEINNQLDEIQACAGHSEHGINAIDTCENGCHSRRNAWAEVDAESACNDRDTKCTSSHQRAQQYHNLFPQCSESSAPSQENVLAKMMEFDHFLNDPLPVDGTSRLNTLDSMIADCHHARDYCANRTNDRQNLWDEYESYSCQCHQHCAMLHACHDHEVTVYGNLISQAEVAESSRKDQWITLSQVDCLCNRITSALSSNTSIADEALTSCDDDVSVEGLTLSTPDPQPPRICPSTQDNLDCGPVYLPPLWRNGEFDAPVPVFQMSGKEYFDGDRFESFGGDVADLPLGDSPYTIELFAKPNWAGRYEPAGLVSWGDCQPQSYMNLKFATCDRVQHDWFQNNMLADSPGPMCDRAYHHIAVTYDGTERSMFVDHVLVRSDTPGAHQVGRKDNFVIGKQNCGDSEAFIGWMKDVKIYADALAPSQMQQAAVFTPHFSDNGVAVFHMPGEHDFDGATSQSFGGDVADLPMGDSPYTIELFVKRTGGGSNDERTLISWGDCEEPRSFMSLGYSACGRLVDSWRMPFLMAQAPSLCDTNYHHVAVTYDGTTRSMFVDHEMVGSDTPGIHEVMQKDNFVIGGDACGAGHGGFIGQIRDLKIYAQALSTSEFQVF